MAKARAEEEDQPEKLNAARPTRAKKLSLGEHEERVRMSGFLMADIR